MHGLMTGVAKFDWEVSNRTIVPKAICERPTSHGGNLSERGSQTTLSQWARYAAQRAQWLSHAHYKPSSHSGFCTFTAPAVGCAQATLWSCGSADRAR
jgi:hypothetical protein